MGVKELLVQLRGLPLILKPVQADLGLLGAGLVHGYFAGHDADRCGLNGICLIAAGSFLEDWNIRGVERYQCMVQANIGGGQDGTSDDRDGPVRHNGRLTRSGVCGGTEAQGGNGGDHFRHLGLFTQVRQPITLMAQNSSADAGQINMIEVHDLTKKFGTFTAVSGLNFHVGSGQIVGFIGPNGAGKTTTMRILTGFLPATEGRAAIAGHDVFEDPMAVRRSIGYLPETPPLYMDLTVGQYLGFIAEIREVPRSDRLHRIGDAMGRLGLEGWEDRILGSLSKGYRQRVGLAQAILHDPKVLILDEPTSGLDPQQLVGIRRFIKGLAEDRTVILSTHILSEVEALADRAIVIDGGKIVADGTLDELRSQVGEGLRYRVELAGSESTAIATSVGALSPVTLVEPLGEAEGAHAFTVRASTDPRTAIARLATENGWEVRAMELHAPDLEEAFLQLVGAEA